MRAALLDTVVAIMLSNADTTGVPPLFARDRALKY
jgi:hypothetical protein